MENNFAILYDNVAFVVRICDTRIVDDTAFKQTLCGSLQIHCIQLREILESRMYIL